MSENRGDRCHKKGVEVNKNLVKEVNEGLVVVCRKSLKVHMVTTY